MSFDKFGCVTLSEKHGLNLGDFARVASSFALATVGARDKYCGILALASKQGAVTIDVPAVDESGHPKMNGDKQLIIQKSMPALEFVRCEMLKELEPSLVKEAFSRLVDYQDAIAQGINPSKWYDVKNTLAKLGVVIGADKSLALPPESKPEERKAAESLVKALKSDAATSKVLRPLLDDTREKFPALFPAKGRKAATSAATASTPVVTTDPVKVQHNAVSVADSLTKANNALENAIKQHELAMTDLTGKGKGLKESKSEVIANVTPEQLKAFADMSKSVLALFSK